MRVREKICQNEFHTFHPSPISLSKEGDQFAENNLLKCPFQSVNQGHNFNQKFQSNWKITVKFSLSYEDNKLINNKENCFTFSVQSDRKTEIDFTPCKTMYIM